MVLFFYWVLLLQFGGAQAGPKNTGTKFVVRYTSGGDTSEFTTYTTGDRRRTESQNAGGHIMSGGLFEYVVRPADVRVVRCDLGWSFDLDSDAQQYIATAHSPRPLVREETTKHELASTEEGTELQETAMRIDVTSVDTGERQEILGHLARHVITTVEQLEMTIDGWYIDFNPESSCETNMRGEMKVASGTFTVGGISVRTPRYEFVYVGPRERGFALHEVLSSTNSALLKNSPRLMSALTYEVEVTQFVEGPIDPALFEVPSGFKRVERLW